MTFARRFLASWRLAKTQAQYDAFADSPASWGPDDAAWLLQVLSSYSGRRLKARMTNMLFRASWEACSGPSKTDFDRGIAKGIANFAMALEQHMNADLYKIEEEEDLSPAEADSASFETTEPAPVL